MLTPCVDNVAVNMYLEKAGAATPKTWFSIVSVSEAYAQDVKLIVSFAWVHNTHSLLGWYQRKMCGFTNAHCIAW